MEGATEIVAIVEAFFNALKTIINALKGLLGLVQDEEGIPEGDVESSTAAK